MKRKHHRTVQSVKELEDVKDVRDKPQIPSIPQHGWSIGVTIIIVTYWWLGALVSQGLVVGFCNLVRRVVYT